MWISDLPVADRPLRLEYARTEVPHLTLEATRTCNLSCALCYTLDRRTVKPLEQVLDELDLGMRRRRLHAVTLVGGEPTTYPHLIELIRAIKERGLACQMLTNGVKLLPKTGPTLLRALRDAGLDKIALHLDGGQPHRDLGAVRERLFDLCEREQLLFSLSLTIYPEFEREIPTLVRRYSRYRYFDGVLAVLGRDPHQEGVHGATLETQHDVLASELGVGPVSYIPSNRDRDEAFWLVYSYFIRTDTGQTFPVSPRVHRLERAIGRLAYGRHPFLPLFRPGRTTTRFVILGALDVLLSPRRLPEYLSMLDRRGSAALRGHYLAVQRPPEVDPESEALVFCRNCPDATVRHGRITPVCIADFVRPLDGHLPIAPKHERWRREVDKHLGETVAPAQPLAR